MKNRRLTLALVTAFFVSGVCTYLLSRSISRSAEASRKETLRYASPTRAVQPGEILRAGDLQLIAWPANNPVNGAFSRLEEVAGRAALYPLEPGQPLLDRELSAPGTGAGLASRIPNGMRALALQSNEVVGVAGFLGPGSRVDVLVTFRGEHTPDPVTTTVLENAEVIAVGHDVEPDPAGKPVTATVVTLLLKPMEAQRALLASSQGLVHFVLRNGADAGHAGSAPVSLSELGGGAPVVSKVNVAPVSVAIPAAARAKPNLVAVAAPVKREPQVETVLGGQSTGKEGTQP